MTPAPDEVPGVPPPPPIHIPVKADEPEITDEPDDVQEQSPEASQPLHTYVSSDPLLSITQPQAQTQIVTEPDEDE